MAPIAILFYFSAFTKSPFLRKYNVFTMHFSLVKSLTFCISHLTRLCDLSVIAVRFNKR